MVIVKKEAPGTSQQALQRFTQRARKAAGLRGKVNVVLTSSREVRALNRRFRGQDKPTDVLSFSPAPLLGGADEFGAGHRPLATSEFSGEIVISADIAARNASIYKHPLAQEVKILILHGMLHLAGYDHESDRGQMARREERLRRELGLTDSLIRRTDQCGSGLRPENARVARAPSPVRVGARSPSSAVRRRTR
jgi:probable rRNA maturation factor